EPDVEDEHGDEDAQDHDEVLHKGGQHADEQFLDRFRVVGDPGHQGAARRLVEKGQAQVLHLGEYVDAQLADHPLGDFMEGEELKIVDSHRGQMKQEIGAGESGDDGPVEVSGNQVIVDEHLDQ